MSVDMLTEIVLPGVVEPDGVQVVNRPIPTPGKGQVLVQMLATGVSFAENSMRRNRYPGQPRFPFVLGYDLVGRVSAVGEGVDRAKLGTRVAAVVKTGGWTTHALLDARDLVPLPDAVSAVDAETVLVNGITAQQMLHRAAKVRRGQTVLVHGASGGVGTVLVQLARHAGVRVIGTGSPRSHDRLRDFGAEPLDYRDPQLAERVRELAPAGVDAVFDNIGGDSFRRSFAQLANGGTLVGYGTAGQRESNDNMLLSFIGILGRFTLWSVLPNGRSATFYNFWGGKAIRPGAFRARLAADLTAVLGLVADGTLQPNVGARVPLREAARALALAESGTVRGKVIIEP